MHHIRLPENTSSKARLLREGSPPKGQIFSKIGDLSRKRRALDDVPGELHLNFKLRKGMYCVFYLMLQRIIIGNKEG